MVVEGKGFLKLKNGNKTREQVVISMKPNLSE